MMEKVLGLTEFEHRYKKYVRIGVKTEVFQAENLKKIQPEGPVLIVANHPVGGIEGVLLAQEILEVRPDLQILANQLLKKSLHLKTYLSVLMYSLKMPR